MDDPLQNSPHLPSIAAGALAAWGAYAMLRSLHHGCNEANACIDCGKCNLTGAHCPGAIDNIAALLPATRSLDANSFVEHRGLACIRCGHCSEWCPVDVNIPLALGAMQLQAMASAQRGDLQSNVISEAYENGKIGAEFIDRFAEYCPVERE